ncbi:anti-repressor SinI family protein [Alteribacter keqinensis]|uniref:DNA-binding anti-repressor SinI n=1 Tax=Alteribacter keqinensis TaxID=2483800 RepID=A0A3M7TTD9_9BACI|nr:anti-repressor SinI family protein [Alteribacter keqinensis]RNA68910.1 DNA-binding anti-repressor SinI [Alteribacter keqinensis]
MAVSGRVDQWYDEEWEELIKEALDMGLTHEEIRSFFNSGIIHKENVIHR